MQKIFKSLLVAVVLATSQVSLAQLYPGVVLDRPEGYTFTSEGGETPIAHADDITLRGTTLDGCLAGMDRVSDVAQALDNGDCLPGPSSQIPATQISFDNTNNIGILAPATTVEAALDLLDATGVGAAPRTFKGSFISTYGLNGSQGQWYGGRQNVVMEGERGQSNGNYTYDLPGISELTSMFDDMASRNVPEIYTLTVGYLGGSVSAINRNSMTVRAANVSPGFDRNEIPVTIAQGSSVTFRIMRIGGVLTNWDRLGVTPATDPVATFGEMVFVSSGWNNSNSSFLPNSSMVQKGYAFPVFGSNPNDGTLRQGLLDAGVSDRSIYDGDYVVWTADAFTSWVDGDNWFVLDRNSVNRLTREATNFLAQTSETDTRVDMGLVSMAGGEALIWLSDGLFSQAPYITPSSDTVASGGPGNPRTGQSYAYIGGREDRDALQRFTFGQNRFSSFITVGISSTFFLGHPASTLDVIVREDGQEIQRFSLEDDFERVPGLDNGSYRYFQRTTSFGYAFLETMEVQTTAIRSTYRLDPHTVDVTANISQGGITEDLLSEDVREKLNVTYTPGDPRFDELEPYVSPAITITLRDADIHARFMNATATTDYPSDLGGFTQVDAVNPRFVSTGTVVFLATPEPGDFLLKNITTKNETPLVQQTANVDLIESVSDSGTTYFVFRVTDLTSGHTFEIDRLTSQTLPKWSYQIDTLQKAVTSIQDMLTHAVFDISEQVLDLFRNNMSVRQDDQSQTLVTDYNKSLGAGDTPKVFMEPAPNAPVDGVVTSRPMSELVGDLAGNKLVYLNEESYASQPYLWGYDGANQTNLITYENGVFNAKVFIAATSASTTSEPVYPAPSNRVSGPDQWINVPTITFLNGRPTTLADEVFFTRNIPIEVVDLKIDYRSHANGSLFITDMTTLPGIGGSDPVQTSVTFSSGDESATLEVRWYPSQRQIRASVTEQVFTGLPTINDVEVKLSFLQERTTPATSATTRDVPLENLSEGPQVFAVTEQDGSLVLVGSTATIDTNRTFTQVFGAGLTGHLSARGESGVFFDFSGFLPTTLTIQDLENHATLTMYGLFEILHSTDAVLDIATGVEAEFFVLESPDGTRWKITIANDGQLITTEE